MICAPALIGGVLILHWRSVRALEVRLAAIRATGAPVTLDEIAAAHAPLSKAKRKKNHPGPRAPSSYHSSLAVRSASPATRRSSGVC